MQGNWLAANWWQLILAFVLAVGYIVTLANNIYETRQLKTTVDDVRKEMKQLHEVIQVHLAAPGLHRGPDFELRMMNIEQQLQNVGKLVGVIGDDVKDVLRLTKDHKE